MITAMVIGSEGQDGTLLLERLESEDARIVAVGRERTSWIRLEPDLPVDVLTPASVDRVVGRLQPDEIYYLAAYHQSSEARGRVEENVLLERSLDVHVLGPGNVLSAIQASSPRTRLLYASSSLVIGDSADTLIDEQTPLSPDSVYGITKAAGMRLCGYYRKRYDIHASAAILFNHESSLRRPDFLSQKIIRAALNILHGGEAPLVLGDLSARVDWGYAPDYVDAMVRIVRAGTAEEFVVATGETHTVQELVQRVFSLAGLDWELYVKEDPSVTRAPSAMRRGNARKLREMTGWHPSVTFDQMVEILWGDALERSRRV